MHKRLQVHIYCFSPWEIQENISNLKKKKCHVSLILYSPLLSLWKVQEVCWNSKSNWLRPLHHISENSYSVFHLWWSKHWKLPRKLLRKIKKTWTKTIVLHLHLPKWRQSSSDFWVHKAWPSAREKIEFVFQLLKILRKLKFTFIGSSLSPYRLVSTTINFSKISLMGLLWRWKKKFCMYWSLE